MEEQMKITTPDGDQIILAEEIDEGEDIRRKFDKQQKKAEEEAEAWMKRQEESMRRATE